MKRLCNATLVVLMTLLLCGCATARRQSDIDLDRSAPNTDYGIRARPDGFEIEVEYARYQFIPESEAVAAACKSQLMTLAYQYADSEKRQIEPINEQRISFSMGRNGLSGMTTCRAHGVASWKQKL
jgi:hypothetical protein